MVAEGRAPGLDLLRAAAIGWVMLYHASMFGLAPAGIGVVKFGWMGVDLFFALSGFLIAGQLLRPWTRGERPAYARFVVRRLMRTLPAYLAVLAFYELVPALRERDGMPALWRFLTFTQNLGLTPGAFSHAWSLCVEEQFYLVLPLAVAFLAPWASGRRVTVLLVALGGLGMGLRAWSWLHLVVDPPFRPDATPHGLRYMTWIYYPTWTRLDDLLAGVAAAAVQTFRPVLWRRLVCQGDRLLLAAAAVIVAAALLFEDQIGGLAAATAGYPLIALGMGVLVIGASKPGGLATRLGGGPVRALAAGAYSLYLSHKLVFHAVTLAAERWPWLAPLALPLALAAALVVGAALYWSVERPFLRLRERLGGMRAGRLAPALG
ncbi:acyltransferase family protein [Caulobacter sp. KR2-114]|uniref:acyltransferase family protein n=1 Tax=Caulobacter sp. KR2-114 TaxID=3400912 RepID=UPI003C0619C9